MFLSVTVMLQRVKDRYIKLIMPAKNKHTQDHDQSQRDSNDLLHVSIPPDYFLFTSKMLFEYKKRPAYWKINKSRLKNGGLAVHISQPQLSYTTEFGKCQRFRAFSAQ